MMGSKFSISYFSRYNNSYLKFLKVLLFFYLTLIVKIMGSLSSSVAYTYVFTVHT